jgi:UDP-galactopyranose mutase
MKINIIGCGLSGVTAAIKLKEKGHDVEIFETRDHIAGNCYDHKTDGVTVHEYGSHIFHTSNERVWEFLNRYTKFNDYSHKVRANTKEGRLSIPFSKKTAEQLGRDLDPEEIKDLLFKEYSGRHWGIPWEELPKSISGRVPNKRDDYDDRYFTDKYQGIPEQGYTKMFEAMLEGIKVNLGVDPNAWKTLKGDLMIWTGRISEYFDSCFGHLPYRSLRFEHTKTKRNPEEFSYELGAVINECNTQPFNRTMDSAVYLDERPEYTILTRDYPEEYVKGQNEPIYPKTFGEGPDLYQKYRELSKTKKDVIFLGRLATYKYIDMHQAVGVALQVINKVS